MKDGTAQELVARRYREVHEATLAGGYRDTLSVARAGTARAALGYRRAGEEALFLERYLDRPVEHCLAEALGRPVPRDSVIEIGNLAADDAFALVALWGSAANDLGGRGEIAVATLTAPLRRMFARIGIPLFELAAADGDDQGDAWGRYYTADPRVCAGVIAQGQRAIAGFLAQRRTAA